MTRLTYRGIEYEPHTTPVDVIPSQTVGKYRGQFWRKNVARMMPLDTRDIDLQYRGVKYHVGVEKEPLTQIMPRVDACAGYKNNERLQCIHVSNIRRNIEHRLQVAKLNGDEVLVRILIDEARQLV